MTLEQDLQEVYKDREDPRLKMMRENRKKRQPKTEKDDSHLPYQERLKRRYSSSASECPKEKRVQQVLQGRVSQKASPARVRQVLQESQGINSFGTLPDRSLGARARFTR